MSGGNPNHASDGKFSSAPGAADGDPSKEAQSTRAVPGTAKGGGTRHVDRRQVVVPHAGRASVGHSMGGGGGSGGGSGQGGRLSSAARDKIVRNKGIDARHYGMPGDLNRRNAAAGSQLNNVQGVSAVYTRDPLLGWQRS